VTTASRRCSRTSWRARRLAAKWRRSSPSAGRLRRGPAASRSGEWRTRAAGKTTAVAAHPAPGAVPEIDEIWSLLSPSPGTGPRRNHRSAATHGYLPLLGRDESIRLQLAVDSTSIGACSASRVGCWLPECAYRRAASGGEKGAPAPSTTSRTPGFATSSPTRISRARAARSAPTARFPGAERFDAERHDPGSARGGRSPARRAFAIPRVPGLRSRRAPARRGAGARSPLLDADLEPAPGYPGDEWYLEFHKIRWPGASAVRVSGANVDLGGKRPYTTGSRTSERRGMPRTRFISPTHRAQQAGDGHYRGPFDPSCRHWWFEGGFPAGRTGAARSGKTLPCGDRVAASRGPCARHGVALARPPGSERRPQHG